VSKHERINCSSDVGDELRAATDNGLTRVDHAKCSIVTVVRAVESSRGGRKRARCYVII
jgi:hypothetical protein